MILKVRLEGHQKQPKALLLYTISHFFYHCYKAMLCTTTFGKAALVFKEYVININLNFTINALFIHKFLIN